MAQQEPRFMNTEVHEEESWFFAPSWAVPSSCNSNFCRIFQRSDSHSSRSLRSIPPAICDATTSPVVAFAGLYARISSVNHHQSCNSAYDPKRPSSPQATTETSTLEPNISYVGIQVEYLQPNTPVRSDYYNSPPNPFSPLRISIRR